MNIDVNKKNVEVITQLFPSGLKSYLFRFDNRFIDECNKYDKEWDKDFRKNIGPDYPYTMSPRTTELIASISTELKKEMTILGFCIDSWMIDTRNEPYVMGVLRRVMVPDTIEPIFGYTDEIATYLSQTYILGKQKILVTAQP